MAPLSTPLGRDPDRHRRIFEELPKLGSPEYMALLRSATAKELPAKVLLMALRQLPQGEAADATLDRLLATESKYGYLGMVRRTAARLCTDDDYFAVNDLVAEAVAEIFMTLRTKRGEGAELAWGTFQVQRTIDAHRRLAGRGKGRTPDGGFARAETDPLTGVTNDPVDDGDASEAFWHGRIASDNTEWLEEFVARAIGEIADPDIRAVAEDQFGADPSPVSGVERDGKVPLATRFNVDRSTIHEWVRIARARIYAALLSQKDREIDLSWLVKTAGSHQKALKSTTKRPHAKRKG